MPGAIIPIISLAVSAIGSGLSFVSAMSAADTQSSLASLNATASLQQIDQQRQTNQLAATINATIAGKEQEAAEANARALKETAAAGDAAARSRTRMSRLEGAKFIAAQRAAAGKAGFSTSTGSPLSLLADTGAKIQDRANEITADNEQTRRQIFREAGQAEIEGQLAGIKQSGANAAGAAAGMNATNAAAQARLDMLGQQAGASAMRTNATSGLFTAFGGMAKDVWNSGLIKRKSTYSSVS